MIDSWRRLHGIVLAYSRIADVRIFCACFARSHSVTRRPVYFKRNSSNLALADREENRRVEILAFFRALFGVSRVEWNVSQFQKIL